MPLSPTEKMKTKSEDELYSFLAKTSGDPERHAAEAELDIRRMKKLDEFERKRMAPMLTAARSSAVAALTSAFVAVFVLLPEHCSRLLAHESTEPETGVHAPASPQGAQAPEDRGQDH